MIDINKMRPNGQAHLNASDHAGTVVSSNPAGGEEQLRIDGLSHGLQFPSDLRLDRTWNDIVDGVIAPGDFGIAYGPSGGGKTFVILSMGFAIAQGKHFGDRETQSTAVLYIGYEGGRGLCKRIIAAREQYGDPHRMFGWLTLPVPLNKGGQGDAGMARIINAANYLRLNSGSDKVLIVIDTLSRSIPGDDESGARDMSAFIELRVSKIIRATGAAIICVHHTGKDEERGMRGSSTLKAACDVVIRVGAFGGETKFVDLEKVKDGVEGRLFAYELHPVELGTDDRGKAMTTCIVKTIDPSIVQSRKKKKRPTGQVAKAFEQLKRMHDRREDFTVPGTEIGIADADRRELWRVVLVEKWRKACRNAELADRKDDDDKRKKDKRENDAFWSAVRSLDQTHQLIGHHGDYVWIAELNTVRRNVSPKGPLACPDVSGFVRKSDTPDKAEADELSGDCVGLVHPTPVGGEATTRYPDTAGHCANPCNAAQDPPQGPPPLDSG